MNVDECNNNKTKMLSCIYEVNVCKRYACGTDGNGYNFNVEKTLDDNNTVSYTYVHP